MAEYLLGAYGNKIVDNRSKYGLATEIYVHDYLNTMIPNGFDFSKLKSEQDEEFWRDTKETARELNVVYDGDANTLYSELATVALGRVWGMTETDMQSVAGLYLLNDYRDRYGLAEAFKKFF